MKTKIVQLTTLALVLAGSFASCTENDIDMSNIDFSNIENLYEQPLPVIQKCVQGKWKWYVTYGGVAGISYSDSTFVTINDDHVIIDYEHGQPTRTIYYTWKKLYVDRGYKTWVMWDKEHDEEFLCFYSITNDTLSVGTPISAFLGHGMGFVRVE